MQPGMQNNYTKLPTPIIITRQKLLLWALTFDNKCSLCLERIPSCVNKYVPWVITTCLVAAGFVRSFPVRKGDFDSIVGVLRPLLCALLYDFMQASVNTPHIWVSMTNNTIVPTPFYCWVHTDVSCSPTKGLPKGKRNLLQQVTFVQGITGVQMNVGKWTINSEEMSGIIYLIKSRGGQKQPGAWRRKTRMHTQRVEACAENGNKPQLPKNLLPSFSSNLNNKEVSENTQAQLLTPKLQLQR